MKVTRRELVGLAMVTTAPVAIAQTAVGGATDEQNRRNAEALDKVGLPMDAEPAFAFKV